MVFEGIDASGKGTQADILAGRLAERGLAVARYAFPRYSGGLYGDLCARYLRGEFGDVGDQSPYLSALPYAGDRLEAAPAIRASLAEADIVLIDRYVGSNIAHQGAKLPLPGLPSFADWVERLEYQVHAIPREDRVWFLDVSVATVVGLLRERQRPDAESAGAGDIHERNAEYLEEVRTRYHWVARHSRHWATVACESGGILRTREEIADEIVADAAGLLRATQRP